MTARIWPLLAALSLVSCQGTNANTLSGSLSQMYDLSFTSVTIVLEGTSVSVSYVNGTTGEPAVLVVDTANIVNVAGSTIDLTQLNAGQPRGVVHRVGVVTTDFPLERGTVSFDQMPKVGSKLSGNFAATFSVPAGYTLDGNFSAAVTAP